MDNYSKFQDQHGVDVDISSYIYADLWLRKPKRKLPRPKLPVFYKKRTGLWLPLSCAYVNIQSAGYSFGSSLGGTTSPVNFAGSDFFGAVIATAAAAVTISDSQSNPNWTYRPTNSQNGSCIIAYCWNATSSGAMTFTLSSSAGGFSALIVMGFSGSYTIGDPFDTDVHTASNGSGTTCQPGSCTPSFANELFITGLSNFVSTDTYSINSGFASTIDMVFQGGQNYAGSASYKIKTDSLAENPTWSSTGNFQSGGVNMATFRQSTAVAAIPRLLTLGVGQ